MSDRHAEDPGRIDPGGHRVGSGAYRRITAALFLAGLATFALLYCTQPILPTLAAEFDVSAAQSTWTVSAATIGLGLGLDEPPRREPGVAAY